MATRKTASKSSTGKRSPGVVKKAGGRAEKALSPQNKKWELLKDYNRKLGNAAERLAVAARALSAQDAKFEELAQAARQFSNTYKELVDKGPGGAPQASD